MLKPCAIPDRSFNPRTYIRYDARGASLKYSVLQFQSTYLHKVRQPMVGIMVRGSVFQSTYLHKVRQNGKEVYEGDIIVSIHVPT